MPNRFALVILDGWGIGGNWGGNAILVAKTPNYNKILREYPNTSIGASGKDVGLPGREVGNSEVGHMNLGAGNVVEQDISLINKSIADGNFYKNEVILNAVQLSRKNNKKLHLVGIVSDGGIHSHINHLFALLKIAKDAGHTNVLIHAFTDGRDTPALKGLEFINKLEYVCSKLNTGKIASIIGRSYLDRKGNWRRTQVAYNAIVDGVGIKEDNSRSAISNAYRQGQTDEYIIPRIIDKNFQPMDSGDSVIFFNFRSDRTRQLTQSFLDRNFNEFKRRYIPDLNFVTFIPYGVEMELKSAAKSAFKSAIIEKTLSSFIEENNLSQVHIAETEKFAHVTYFFNGNRNDPFKHETRILIPSPDVKSYAEIPEMSSEKVKEALVTSIKRKDHYFTLCNFANGDMVGHTGDFKAAVTAVESIDAHLKDIVKASLDNDVKLIITADHGNIEQMVDPETGQPDPEHTRNKVPLILVSSDKDFSLNSGGKLGNVAATALRFSGFDCPNYFLSNLFS